MNNNILFFLPGLENTKIKIFDENFGNEKILEIEKGHQNTSNSENRVSENEKIFNFLEKNSIKIEDISKIFFCNGPGRFMSMRISAIIANTFKNQNRNIELFSIPTAEFLKEKSGGKNIFLQLNNSEIFTLINGEKKVYKRDCLENKFSGEKEVIFYGNLKKGLFDFENFIEIEEKNLISDEKILENFSEKGEKFLTNQIKIFYGK